MSHYIDKFGLSKEQTKQRPKTDNWTGGEIEALCHNALMLDSTLQEAAKYIKPQYVTMGESIKALEQWAQDRCINADEWSDKGLKVVSKRKIDM